MVAKPVSPNRTWLLEMIGTLRLASELPESQRLFSDKSAARVSHEGIWFRSRRLDLEERVGGNSGYSLRYEFGIENDALGTLLFERGTAFSQAETGAVETLIPIWCIRCVTTSRIKKSSTKRLANR